MNVSCTAMRGKLWSKIYTWMESIGSHCSWHTLDLLLNRLMEESMESVPGEDMHAEVASYSEYKAMECLHA